MSTAFVQSFPFASAGSSSDTVTMALAGVAVGDIVVVALFWNTPGVAPSSVTDNATIPNTWTLIPGTLQTGTYAIQLAWAYIASIAAGTVSVTAHWASAVAYAAMEGAEFSGLGATPVIDQVAGASGTAVPQSPSITTLFADEVLFGAVFPSAFITVMDAGSGWAKVTTTNDLYFISEYKTTSSIGTFQAATTPGLPSQEYRAAIVSLSATAVYPIAGTIMDDSSPAVAVPDVTILPSVGAFYVAHFVTGGIAGASDTIPSAAFDSTLGNFGITLAGIRV